MIKANHQTPTDALFATTPLDRSTFQKFWEDGFVILPKLFDDEEVSLLNQAIAHYADINRKAMKLRDNEGGVTDLAIWNHPGDDVFGMLSRCRRMVDSCELLIGGEVYHYHAKLTAKPPLTGGAWDWHQDYGYWYDNGILFPNCLSVMVAVDPSTRENGCLQVVKGSHLLGRIDHGVNRDQKGANEARVNAILERLDLVYAELAPGDALFFHGNTLHRSDQNRSSNSRNVLISSYNRADNSSWYEHQHPNYTPLNKVDDDALKRIGLSGLGKDREFMPQPDKIE